MSSAVPDESSPIQTILLGRGEVLSVPLVESALFILTCERNELKFGIWSLQWRDKGDFCSSYFSSFQTDLREYLKQLKNEGCKRDEIRTRLVLLCTRQSPSFAKWMQLSRNLELFLQKFGIVLRKQILDPTEAEEIRIQDRQGLRLHVRRSDHGQTEVGPHHLQKKIRLVIVDDSPSMRATIRKMIDGEQDIECVGEAADPIEAEEKFAEWKPDVMTLDMQMPRMDGESYLRKLMERQFRGVIMISGAERPDGDRALNCLSLGAVDFLLKPNRNELNHFQSHLLEKLRVAAQVSQRARSGAIAWRDERSASHGPAPGAARFHAWERSAPDQLIVMGASTGGTVALAEVLMQLPPDMPPILIVQHIPPVYSASFAARLDRLCALTVYEAADCQAIESGCVYVAPGDRHLEIRIGKDGMRTRLNDGEPVNRHKPSVDVLFSSVTSELAPRAVGVLMTGMGADGAQGLLRMKQMGARTLTQDEASCVVYGMPRAAVRLGASEEEVKLSRIADRLVQLTRMRKSRAS